MLLSSFLPAKFEPRNTGADRAINLEKISDLMEFFHDFVKDRDMFLGQISHQKGWEIGFWGWLEYLLSLKLTASLHLKMDGWKMSFLLGFGLFSGALAVKVSGSR